MDPACAHRDGVFLGHLIYHAFVFCFPIDQVAALTCQDRSLWAHQRETFLSDGINAHSRAMIETAAFVLILDDARPESWTETGFQTLCGDGTNR